jgi:hypothetical protein
MFTYQVRQRSYKLAHGQQFIFPDAFEAVFVLQPLQPFGASAGGGRTAVRNVGASSFYNANTGHHSVESKEPLRPLEVLLDWPETRMVIRGNFFTVSGRVETESELDETLYSYYYILPILLNAEFGDPPVIERVEGKVGAVPFRWELSDWRMDIHLTTQDEQETRAMASLKRFEIIAVEDNRRLVAALHYFHVFCRLCRAGNTPWEFMSEAIVNLSKILEVLFPPDGDSQTIEAARKGLANLGYSQSDIERLYVPAMILRGSVDAAHVDLSIFKGEELKVLHSYTEIAEPAFRQLLSKVLTEIESRSYKVCPHPGAGPDARTVKTIAHLAKNLMGAQTVPQNRA